MRNRRIYMGKVLRSTPDKKNKLGKNWEAHVW